jgi:hypothetical protein
MMGSEITVESALGVGSTFTIQTELPEGCSDPRVRPGNRGIEKEGDGEDPVGRG